MNKGQHNTFKKLSPDFFSIEVLLNLVHGHPASLTGDDRLVII